MTFHSKNNSFFCPQHPHDHKNFASFWVIVSKAQDGRRSNGRYQFWISGVGNGDFGGFLRLYQARDPVSPASSPSSPYFFLSLFLSGTLESAVRGKYNVCPGINDSTLAFCRSNVCDTPPFPMFLFYLCIHISPPRPSVLLFLHKCHQHITCYIIFGYLFFAVCRK